MTAKHYALDNLVAVVDRNHYQCDGPTCAVMDTDPFADKWTGFGWQVREADGHNVEALVSAFSSIPLQPGRPTAIICKTVKGNGVSFMENAEEWHYRAPEGEELESALLELAAHRGGA